MIPFRVSVVWEFLIAAVLSGFAGCGQPASSPPTPEEAAKTPSLAPPQGSEGTRSATDGG